MTRVLTKDWNKPKRWNAIESDKEALRDAVGNAPPPEDKVFPSMCDPFDDRVPPEWIMRFMNLICGTPSLTWLLLTKRPMITKRSLVDPPDNLWLGVSCENQETADERIPILLSVPARVWFVSCEPLLGPVDLSRVEMWRTFETGMLPDGAEPELAIDWVIAGGESGFNHRRMEVEWIQSLAYQCKAAGVPFFCKQDSARFPGEQGAIPNELWNTKQFPNHD